MEDETIEDAVLAVNLLKGDDRIDPSRVFILGHSLGGQILDRLKKSDSKIKT